MQGILANKFGVRQMFKNMVWIYYIKYFMASILLVCSLKNSEELKQPLLLMNHYHIIK